MVGKYRLKAPAARADRWDRSEGSTLPAITVEAWVRLLACRHYGGGGRDGSGWRRRHRQRVKPAIAGHVRADGHVCVGSPMVLCAAAVLPSQEWSDGGRDTF